MSLETYYKYYEYHGMDIKLVKCLKYNEDACLRQIMSKESRKKQNQKKGKTEKEQKEIKKTYISADFECISNGVHKAYAAGYKVHKLIHPKTYYSLDEKMCVLRMLNEVPDHSVIRFHNLSYDINIFSKLGIVSSVNMRNNFYAATLHYYPEKYGLDKPVTAS